MKLALYKIPNANGSFNSTRTLGACFYTTYLYFIKFTHSYSLWKVTNLHFQDVGAFSRSVGMIVWQISTTALSRLSTQLWPSRLQPSLDDEYGHITQQRARHSSGYCGPDFSGINIPAMEDAAPSHRCGILSRLPRGSSQ